MNIVPEVFDNVLQFIGDYRELSFIRTVSKSIKNAIKSKHILSMEITIPDEFYLLQNITISSQIRDLTLILGNDCEDRNICEEHDYKEYTVDNYINLNNANDAINDYIDTGAARYFIWRFQTFPECRRLNIQGSYHHVYLGGLPKCRHFEANHIILYNIDQLNECRYFKTIGCIIGTLPTLPKCLYINTMNSCIERIEPMPNVLILSCPDSNVNTIEDMPKCVILNAAGNYITQLPELPCAKTIITCENEMIEYAGEYPECRIWMTDDLDPETVELPKVLDTFFDKEKEFHFKYYYYLQCTYDDIADLYLDVSDIDFETPL